MRYLDGVHMRLITTFLVVCAVAFPATCQDRADPTDDEYRRSLDEHRQAVAEAERQSRLVSYVTLAVVGGLVAWAVLTALREAGARRRLNEQAARLEVRNQEFLATSPRRRSARMIELLESIDRQIRERESAGDGS